MKYSPLVAAIVGAVGLTLQQFISQPEVSVQVILLAVLIAVLGVVGTQLKGKGVTVAGIVGTVAYTAYTVYNTGEFTWREFILTAAAAVLALVAPSAIPEKENPE